jgi:hypothetical protein
MPTSRKSEVERLVQQASGTGWAVSIDGSGHYAFYPPDGSQPVRVPKTPGRGRSLQNVRAQLRNAGLPIPHRGGHLPVAFRQPKGVKVTETAPDERTGRDQQPETDQVKKERGGTSVSPARVESVFEAVATAPYPHTATEVANELRVSRSAVNAALKVLRESGRLFSRQADRDVDEGIDRSRSAPNLWSASDPVPTRVLPSSKATERRSEPAPVATTPEPDRTPERVTEARMVDDPRPPNMGLRVEGLILVDGEGETWIARRASQANV